MSYKWESYLAFLVYITGHLNNSNFAEKQQTVHKFVQQCWFFQSEVITSKFGNQSDKIVPFTNPFSFPKEMIN